MYEEILSEIGFTRSEIAVYFALLEIGSSTTGPIIKKAGIAAGKAYIIMDKLIDKGLVTYYVRSGTKYFQAKDPERILDYLKEKEQHFKQQEEELKNIIPKLKAEYEEASYQPVAEVYEGEKGFKTLLSWEIKAMQPGDTIYLLGVPKEAHLKHAAYLKEWNEERIKKKAKMKIIYNHDCKSIGETREKMPLTEVRYMKEALETPAWIAILREYVITINVHGKPACFLIKNKETAESYRKYFELLWEKAEQSRGK